jgi:uncharacterized protein YraI
MATRVFIFVCGVLVLLMASCSQAPADTQALETVIAAKIYTTLTAQAPTITPQPTITPAVLATLPPAATATVFIKGTVISPGLNMREGPGTNYAVIQQIKSGDPVQVTGGYNHCEWVKIKTTDAKEGWVKTGEGYLTYSGDCTVIPSGVYRPITGSLINDARTNRGYGQLKVGNGTRSDGLVVLVGENKEPLVAFYVRSMDQFTLDGVPNGIYTVFYARGNDWVGDLKKFQKVDAMIRLDDPLKLPDKLIWAVRLDGEPTGTVEPGSAVNSSKITQKDFPTLK